MSVLAPAVVAVRAQVPAATVPMQLSVPSPTVTLPVGVPPGDVTVKLIVTASPTSDGSGVSPVIVVVVAAGFTAWATPAEVLPAKLALPAYVAVRVLAPGVVGTSVQPPAATVPEQLTVPSLTVTLPLGAPPVEVTVKLTAIP